VAPLLVVAMKTPVAYRQPAFPWQPLCAPLFGGWVLLILASKYEVDVTTHNGVMAHFTCSRYMAV